MYAYNLYSYKYYSKQVQTDAEQSRVYHEVN